MYDLDVVPLTDAPSIQNFGDDVCVLVGDNITIQEHPKKVRFALPQLVPEPEPVPVPIETSDVSATIINVPPITQTSLFAVDGTFGTNYDMPCSTTVIISPPASPLTLEQQMEALPWKTKLAIKACYAVGFSLPFIVVAIIQPWKTG
jgi:hypothetical protein